MHLRRTAVAVTAAAAVVLGPIAVGTADAKPPTAAAKATKATKAKKTQVKQLVNDVAVKDKLLARIAVSSVVVGLADEDEAVLVDSITADRAALAAIRDAGVAAPATAAAARVVVRSFRTEVYVQAAEIIQEAADLAADAVDNPDAAALLDEATAAALGLDARSPKADVQAAHRALEDAEELLAAAGVVTGDPESPAVTG